MNEGAATFASAGLNDPFDLAFAPDNTLFVTSASTETIVHYSATGSLLVTIFTTFQTYGIAFAPQVTPAVPEPGSMALVVGLEAAGAGFLARRRRNAV